MRKRIQISTKPIACMPRSITVSSWKSKTVRCHFKRKRLVHFDIKGIRQNQRIARALFSKFRAVTTKKRPNTEIM
jgi:hypothetical protein